MAPSASASSLPSRPCWCCNSLGSMDLTLVKATDLISGEESLISLGLATFSELMSRIKSLVGSNLKNAVHTVYDVIMSSTINRNNKVKGTGNSKGDGVAFGKGCWDTAASPRS